MESSRKAEMSKSSLGEATLCLQLKAMGIKAEREYRFHPVRKWRFDFAIPDRLIGIEIEGGTWVAGRHNRGSGFEADCVKYSEAAVLGWRIIRATTDQVRRGEALIWIKSALGGGVQGSYSESPKT